MARLLKFMVLGLVGLFALSIGTAWLFGAGYFGTDEGPGTIVGTARPLVATPAPHGIGANADKQILFGDLHTHTTISIDAFLTSLPSTGLPDTHTQADACDFARFCSALDFWSINDHAFSISPRAWSDTINAIRQCDARAGDPANPDMVSFLGYEWTQIGKTPETHYGHKNVIFRDLADGTIPARPIASRERLDLPAMGLGLLNIIDPSPRYRNLARFVAELRKMDRCPDGVPSDQLPAGCFELAETPDMLFRKLDEGGHAALVIPHGTSWGNYTPPGSSWNKQLKGAMHNDRYQKLIEIYSGHGNSEIHRPWRAAVIDANGTAHCPEPSENYLPSCWQAGEIIRTRCLKAGTDAKTCDGRAEQARRLWIANGVRGIEVVAGFDPDDWLDAGQCRDCGFQPTFSHRPGSTSQAIAAMSNFDEPDRKGHPRRFRFGYIASSDNHSARAGTGYKEVVRRGVMTDATGMTTGITAKLFADTGGEKLPYPVDPTDASVALFSNGETDRMVSYLYTGGLVAVHAEGRNRGAIWDALQRKETYATSGPRILLWFDLVGADGTRHPMGSEALSADAPLFEVRALGSYKQKPGCPPYAEIALGTDRITRLCAGECYNPSDTRRPITRIEIVRIRPQSEPGQPLGERIDDPYLVKTCPADGSGCAFRFTDPEFPLLKQTALYYARAIEAPKPLINSGLMRCTYDTDGNCVAVNPCYGDLRTPLDDNCLATDEPRAWSSPIYVDWKAPH